MKSIMEHAQAAVASYSDSPPDPSFVLQLPDDVYSGSNLYAVQKIFDGSFQFDVYFDSGSVKQKLTCKQFILNFADKC
jgi:mannosyl-oligosaccharide glucosidase